MPEIDPKFMRDGYSSEQVIRDIRLNNPSYLRRVTEAKTYC